LAKLPAPPPPARLVALGADEKVVPVGTTFFRVYFRGARHPVTWRAFRAYGPTDARFDQQLPPPREQERGILYLAIHPRTALAEAFQRRRTINARRLAPWLVGFQTAAPLGLLDLTGLWPTRAGASMALSTGPHARTRPWSRAAYAAYPHLHGLWYGSSMDSLRGCVALYERAAHALPVAPAFHRALADPALRALLEHWAAELSYRLIL
jgi:RES domain